MMPRSKCFVLLVLSVVACCYGQDNGTDATTNDTTTQAPVATTTTPTTTTTVIVPSTTASPGADHPTAAPGTDPAQGSWDVTDPATNRTCILSEMGIRLGFKYTNNENETASRSYDVPVNETTLDGSCGSNATAPESMTISFFEDVWKLALDFTLMEGNKEWAITKIALTFDTTDFGDYDNSTYTVSLNQPLFQTPNASSYQCVTQDTISLTDAPAGAPTVNITTNHLRIQAFREQGPGGSFSTAVPCPADTNVSNIVPIAVGAALAALVVIVLIAYLIGRKKNKRGYESV